MFNTKKIIPATKDQDLDDFIFGDEVVLPSQK